MPAASPRRGPDGIWSRGGSRFAGWPVLRARIALAMLALLIVATLSVIAAPVPRQAAPDPADRPTANGDLFLYDEIATAVRNDGNYYVIAADALRREGYPLRPFVTVRMPALTMMLAWLPPFVVQAMLWMLAATVAGAWIWRLRRAFTRATPMLLAIALLAAGLIVFVQTGLMAMHEMWAGLLIALSLGRWRPDRWVEPVALGLAAMLLRETAGLYCGLMFVVALATRRRGEAIGWAVALGVMALAVAAHAHAVAQVVRDTDPASSGWHGLGFGYFVRTMILSTGLALFPAWLAAPLVGLGLFGWAAWRDPVAPRVLAMLAGYAVLIAIAERVDTFYWGLLAAPLLLCGVAFAPDGIVDLWHAARGRRRRYTVTKVSRPANLR